MIPSFLAFVNEDVGDAELESIRQQHKVLKIRQLELRERELLIALTRLRNEIRKVRNER